ncbi:NAD(P)-binding domain-containing protein [Streptomyces lydicus]|uniref:ornithine cyclodeaminase family protein n=1 Tax=Streptomyces lydicus TaxID=47763 RepID=UPI002E3394A8|nr:ornithine cyclodeaminase family protein [Streptomyces lydicus]
MTPPTAPRTPAPVLLGDAEVRARLTPATATAAVRHALLQHQAGRLAAPPRLHAGLGGGELVFTVGALAAEGAQGVAGVHGFRAYGTADRSGEQLVAVWESTSGRLTAVVHGQELGPRRTGAVEALARTGGPAGCRLGLIGTGPQGWAQLWALSASASHRPAEVVVFGRRRERAERFAARVREELDLAARAVDSARAAVQGREVVIVATNSPTPVLESDWVAPGTHLSTLGPKSTTHYELPPELAERAAVIATDSPAQAGSYGTDHLLGPTPLTALGAVLAGTAPGRGGHDDITLFSSVGLAGTEVAIAAALTRA